MSKAKNPKPDGRAKNGGKRAGASRPQKYGEPTKQLKISVPVSKIEEFLMRVNKILKPWVVHPPKVKK